MDHLLPQTPAAIRKIRLYNHTFNIVYLGDFTACIPAISLCEALNIEYETVVGKFAKNPYLSIYVKKVSIPNGGNEGETETILCFEMLILPVLLIAINLSKDQDEPRNSLLDWMCDDASAELAQHYHVVYRSDLQTYRRELRKEVADIMKRYEGGIPDPF